MVAMVLAGGRTAIRKTAGSSAIARWSASTQTAGSTMNVALGCRTMNDVKEFSIWAGLKVPSTMAAVGTRRGT